MLVILLVHSRECGMALLQPEMDPNARKGWGSEKISKHKLTRSNLLNFAWLDFCLLARTRRPRRPDYPRDSEMLKEAERVRFHAFRLEEPFAPRTPEAPRNLAQCSRPGFCWGKPKGFSSRKCLKPKSQLEVMVGDRKQLTLKRKDKRGNWKCNG